jgi:DNA-binding NtrC family response regulator
MTALRECPTRQIAGSIIVVGDAGPHATGSADAVASLADVTVVGAAEAPRVLANTQADVVIIDERDGDAAAARQLITDVRRAWPETLCILLSAGDTGLVPGEGCDATVLPKPVETRVLRAICTVALQCAEARRSARELESENSRLRGTTAETATFALDELGDMERYEGILTRSPAMKRILTLLRKIEGSDTSVLIHGETGTGKELVAQAIHARSRSRTGRFVAVNLGAISDHLRESELFGHVRGAFTGATDTRGGLFVEANGGCIFLDEVGDASPGLQVALLRVLEEGTITPVGSDRPRRVDVRVISGTNRNLEELVRQGLFRRDLYYRLNVFPIELPPLRERPEDIFPLAKHFLVQASMAMGKKAPGISREARAVLEAYHWEGNVRELRNVMERAAILCKGGLVIAADLPMTLDRKVPTGTANGAAWTIAIPPGGAKLQQLEREIFLKTLSLAGDNQSRAARILGLRESTFRFRLQKLGIASRRTATVSLGRVASIALALLHQAFSLID